MHIVNVVANPKPVAESHSKQLADAFFKALKVANHQAKVTTIDLAAKAPPFYSYEMYRYFWYPVFDQSFRPSAQEQAAAVYAVEQCKLFTSADVLVFTAPMWNFSLPAVLKAWIDMVLMPNHTFAIGAGGVKGMHKIRKVVLLAASGGTYADGDPRDCLRAEIKAAFGFIGINDIAVAWAQGQNPFFFADHAARKTAALKEAEALGRVVGELKV